MRQAYFTVTARQMDELGRLQDIERAEARARAIRAVVAAQWAVACALDAQGYEREARYSSDNAWDIEKIAALPTAEQIVDGTA